MNIVNIASKSVALAKWAVGLTLSAALVACGGSGGGGGSPPTPAVASANAAVPVTAANIKALAPVSGATPIVFLFNSGFSGVDATGTAVNLGGSTTVSVTKAGTPASTLTPATLPTATITNGGNTASGDMTFGSCIFTVKSSTFPATSPLGVGNQITVDPCILTINTSGATAGDTTNLNATLTFGSTTSTTSTLPVMISSDGSVSVGGILVGTVNLTPVTGAGG